MSVKGSLNVPFRALQGRFISDFLKALPTIMVFSYALSIKLLCIKIYLSITPYKAHCLQFFSTIIINRFGVPIIEIDWSPFSFCT